MRSTVYFFPPRTSVTASVGINTRPIFPSSPKAWTRDSSDSLTLRSNPEYEWMMYHFIFGLRGCSATVVPPSTGDAPASVASLFGSSCMMKSSLLRKHVEQVVHATANDVVDHPEEQAKQKHRDQHHNRCRLHLFTRRRCDLTHLGAHVVIKGLDPLRPRLDSTKALIACRCY